MKIEVTLTKQTIENNLQKIKHMLLYDELKLTNIKRSQRISHKNFYIMAFRASRNKHNCDEYINNLKILETDIFYCKDDNKKKQLKKLFYLYITLNPYTENAVFKNFIKQVSLGGTLV